MSPRTIASYTHQLRGSLPARAFRPVPSRLAWLAFHLAVIAFGIAAIAAGLGGRALAPVWSIAIGHAFAGCAFVGHETLHGAVVRARRLRRVVGWLAFLPFSLSPRLWVVWHNQVHHGHTMKDGVDPDAYPTLASYRGDRLLRIADHFSPGRGRWAGVVTLLLGFSLQSGQMLWRWARATGAMSRQEHRLAIAETLAGWAVWAGVAIAVGPLGFLFAFVLPLLIGNLIVMSYILTNHSLSPLTEVNDPLLNSLTVTTPRLISFLHLDFGLHVEHHLFPSMSGRYAPLVRAELAARWPERYQSMPLHAALARLFTTARVYASPTRLHDPRSEREWSTLMPGERARPRPPATETLIAETALS